MDNYLYYILAGIIGLCIGSFLNVVIYRLPRKIPLMFARSECPNCKNKIAFYDNIPVLSYLILGGKCRKCKTRISFRYPLIEIINMVAYLVMAHYFQLTPMFFIFAVLSSALIAIFFIDLDFQIIPDSITLPGILIGLGVSFLPNGIGIVSSAIGMVVGGGSLYLVAILGDKLFKKESMGGGDIKMAAMLGAFLGWQKVVFIFFGSAAVGMVISIFVLALSKKIRRSRMIPFGPFLAIAAFIAILYGDTIIAYYINNFLRV